MPDEQTDFLHAELSANELRALAEATDAIRNTDGCVVKNPNPNGPRYLAVSAKVAAKENLKPLLSLKTDDMPRLKGKRERLLLTADRAITLDGNISIDINECDAVFTSLSAVEKFVVPYYARMRGLAECESLRMKFADNASAVAILHLPGSVPLVAHTSSQTSMFVASAASGPKAGTALVMSSVAAFLK